MIRVNSYIIPETNNIESNNINIIIDKCNTNLLKCPIKDFNYYSFLIKNNINIIINNSHNSIDNYLKQNRNIFNGKLKFNNSSILIDVEIYMGIKLLYTNDSIKLTIYLLNKLPEIMINNEIYFKNNSLIDKKECIFDLNVLTNEGKLNRKLNLILYDIFDSTFYSMIKNY